MVLVIAIMFSCFYLWLLSSWVKYLAFVFGILVILILYSASLYDKKKLRIGIVRFGGARRYLKLSIDLFLMASSLTLLALYSFSISGGFAQVILALFVSSILPGYAMLNILGYAERLSGLQTLVLSFVSSYVLSGFISLICLLVAKPVLPEVVLATYAGMALFSAWFSLTRPHKEGSVHFALNFETAALFFAIALYLLPIFIIYPGFALSAGTDSSKHYGNSTTLWNATDLYQGYKYILFHSNEMFFLLISNSSVVLFQTTLYILNIFLPLSFYVMAKQHLRRIDARLPAVSLILWVLFTNGVSGGFSWFFFAARRLIFNQEPVLSTFSAVRDYAYNGTFYDFFSPDYLPATVALIFLMTLVFLMGKKEIAGKRYCLLFSLMIASMVLSYAPIAVVFSLFLVVYGSLSRREDLKIDESLGSSILGFLLAASVYYVFSLVSYTFNVSISLLLSLFVPPLISVVALTIRKLFSSKTCHQQHSWAERIGQSTLLVSALMFFYILGLLTWLTGVSFQTPWVDPSGFVPWFMYPVMLGINGILAILSLHRVSRVNRYWQALTFFLAFLVFVLIAGRAISWINSILSETVYYEERFIWFIRIPLAVLAGITLLCLLDYMRKRVARMNRRAIGCSVVIGLIVLGGASSTFLSFDFWHMVTSNPSYLISRDEFIAISYLRSAFENDKTAWAAVTNWNSGEKLDLSGSPEIGPYPNLYDLLYSPYNPEIVFLNLYRRPYYSNMYYYVDQEGAGILSAYQNRFLASYLSCAPIVFDNSAAVIYNISKPSFPIQDSSTVLITPYQGTVMSRNQLYFAYYLLCQGFYNFTVMYDIDAEILRAKCRILPFDPPSSAGYNESYLNRFLNGGKLVVLNTNGYGIVSSNIFEVLNSSLEVDQITQYNNTICLPRPIEANSLKLKDNATEIKSYYLSANGTIPYVIQKEIGNTTLFYVNVYPIQRDINANQRGRQFYRVLQSLLSGLGFEKFDPSYNPRVEAYVRQIDASSGVQIDTPSLLFPSHMNITHLILKNSNGYISLDNISAITMQKYSNIVTRTDRLVIADGTGLYASLRLAYPFSISAPGGLGIVTIQTGNGTVVFCGVEQLNATSGADFAALARTPKITSSKVLFEGCYSLGDLYALTGGYGQNLEATGLTEFNVTLSDSFVALNDVKFPRSFSLEPPLLNYNEFAVFPESLYLSLLLIPIFAAVAFVQKRGILVCASQRLAEFWLLVRRKLVT